MNNPLCTAQIDPVEEGSSHKQQVASADLNESPKCLNHVHCQGLPFGLKYQQQHGRHDMILDKRAMEVG